MKSLVLTFMFACTVVFTTKAQTTQPLTGRYIMKGASCAGFNFINSKTVLWYNELTCSNPDTLRIKYVDGNAFLTIATERLMKDCPPRVDYYKIVSNNGKQLILKSVWTGWNNAKDDIEVFNKQ